MPRLTNEILMESHRAQIRDLVDQTARSHERSFGTTPDGVEMSVNPVRRVRPGVPRKAHLRLTWIGPWETGGALYFDAEGRLLRRHSEAA